ncbi:MAG: acylneuraminate cytidylyltransferase family protein [Lewinella sp.]
MSKRKLLAVIPARGGSKGIPGKNIKKIDGRPLLAYSIDCARAVAQDADICVSTDDASIRAVAEKEGLVVPFLRPKELATDQSGTYEVLLHALDFYGAAGQHYDDLLLLQPTSPLRKPDQVREALSIYYEQLPEMLVSVKTSSANPYYNLFEEATSGYLQKSKDSDFIRRQDCPSVYEYNGAIYVVNIAALRERPMHKLERVIKYVMDGRSSFDLDTSEDWAYLQYLLQQGKEL